MSTLLWENSFDLLDNFTGLRDIFQGQIKMYWQFLMIGLSNYIYKKKPFKLDHI